MIAPLAGACATPALSGLVSRSVCARTGSALAPPRLFLRRVQR